MTTLYDQLYWYIETELRNSIGSDPEGDLRRGFAGPGPDQLKALYEFLVDGDRGMCLKTAEGDTKEVRVYLIDETAEDPAEPPAPAPAHARCTQGYLSSVRTHTNGPYLALHQMNSLYETHDTTQLVLGLGKEIHIFGEWKATEFISVLIRGLVGESYAEEGSQLQKVVDQALEEAWDADEGEDDRSKVWRLLENLAFASRRVPLQAILGFPSCSEEQFGTKTHLAVLGRLSRHLESSGMTRGFRELEEVAKESADLAGDKLVPHLQAFHDHLVNDKEILEAAGFSGSEHSHYSPFTGEGSEPPSWWNKLSLAVWDHLLDDPDPDPLGELNVQVLNRLGAAARGMHTLVRDVVELEVSVPDCEDPVEVTVERANGNAAWNEVGTIQVDPAAAKSFVDADIPEHNIFVRYRITAPDKNPLVIKLIVMDFYGPGVVACGRMAEKSTPFKQKKVKGRRNEKRYECDMHLKGMGSHNVDLFTSKHVTVGGEILGYEVDAEHLVPAGKQIKRIDANHSVCLIETDEDCHYEFEVQRDAGVDPETFRINVTAEEVAATGATSEFDRLVIANRAAAKGERSTAAVEPSNSRVMDLERWMLEEPKHSCRPLLLGPDYVDDWGSVDWSEQPKLSGLTLPVDPRPSAGEFALPQDFVEARAAVLRHLMPLSGESVDIEAIRVHELHQRMEDPEFEQAIGSLLQAYTDWLEADYDTAAWADVVCVHAKQVGTHALDARPYAILLSPFHPIKLAWQCKAQAMLNTALVMNDRCPAASMMNPASFPDCMLLPCRTASGSVDRRRFVAMASSSDYWGVLWSVDNFDRLNADGGSSVFGADMGISVDGLAAGCSEQQVSRTLKEVSRLVSAKSTLRVGIVSDTVGSSSCNEGIEGWCSENLGPPEDDQDEDAWWSAGSRSLIVDDRRPPHLHPEQAALASLTARTGAAVRWYTERKPGAVDVAKNDLTVIAHLGTTNRDVEKHNFRSAVDGSGLTRWRIRKQIARQGTEFVAESRIGQIPSSLDEDSVTGRLLACVDTIERQCKEDFDCYVFAPDTETLRRIIDESSYTAVSASNVDAACFFGKDRAYLWDYELPSYARRSGENSGYYLLASQTPLMLSAVRAALKRFGAADDLPDSKIALLLDEVSRRGVPTLKGLTSGGSVSFGEVGMLVALRFMQTDFENSELSEGESGEAEAKGEGLLNVGGADRTLNLVVPVDPFQSQFHDLRVALEGKKGERPDLLVLSIRFDETGRPRSLKLTPVEVKTRTDTMSSGDRSNALSQASAFAEFLDNLQNKDSSLWQFGWRSLLATLLDYGFRVCGQLKRFMETTEWAERHSEVLRALAGEELSIEVDKRGRLIVIDHTTNSGLVDLDGDGFNETVVLSHSDAFQIIEKGGGIVAQEMERNIGDWELKPNSTDMPPVDPPDDTGLVDPPDDTGPVDPPDVADPSGIEFPVGEMRRGYGEEQVLFSPGNTELTHLNVGIVGTMGTGKTQLVQALIYQLSQAKESNRGVQPRALIFDYKADYTKDEFVKATGARVIRPRHIPLNLFDTTDSPETSNVWLDRSKFFADVLNKIYSGIGPVQKQNLKSAIKKAYIDADNSGRKAPTINDVFDQYHQQCGGKADAPYSIMSDLVDGEYFVSDCSKVEPFSKLLDGVVVLDLASVGQDDDTKNMLVVIFLNLFYEHMLTIEKKEFVGKDPSFRFVDTMLLVDEAENIMSYEFDVLKKVLLQGREFGVGVILASQYLSHFRTRHENYLEPMLTWFVHKVDTITVRDMEGIGLTAGTDTADRIRSLQQHECVYKSLGVDGATIRGKPFYELYTESET